MGIFAGRAENGIGKTFYNQNKTKKEKTMKVRILGNEVVEIHDRKGKTKSSKKCEKSKDSRRFDILKEKRNGKNARRHSATREQYLDANSIDS